jgi:hypothetical protein
MRIVEISRWNGGRLGNNVLQILHAAWLADVFDAEVIRCPPHPLLRRDTAMMWRVFPPQDPSEEEVLVSGEWFRAAEAVAATGGMRRIRFDELRNLARRYSLASRIAGLELGDDDNSSNGNIITTDDAEEEGGGRGGGGGGEAKVPALPVRSLVVHFRGGDIFPAPESRLRPNPHYVQLPRSMVSAVVGVEMAECRAVRRARGEEVDHAEEGEATFGRPPSGAKGAEGTPSAAKVSEEPFRFAAVAEDMSNPVARWWKVGRGWNCEEGGDPVTALRDLCMTRTLCHGYSTFAHAALLLSPHIRRVYCAAFFAPAAGSGEIEVRAVPLEGYMLPGTWRNTPSQRQLMMSYVLPKSALLAIAGEQQQQQQGRTSRTAAGRPTSGAIPEELAPKGQWADGTPSGAKVSSATATAAPFSSFSSSSSIPALLAAAAFASQRSHTEALPTKKPLHVIAEERKRAKLLRDREVAAREARYRQQRRTGKPGDIGNIGNSSSSRIAASLSSPPPAPAARCKLGRDQVYEALFGEEGGDAGSTMAIAAHQVTAPMLAELLSRQKRF